MKTITVSDEDYLTLMALSLELQTQENQMQAFPYFWEPASYKKVTCEDGDEPMIYFEGDSHSPESFSEYYEDHWKKYCEYYDVEAIDDVEPTYPKYNEDDETTWIDYIKDNVSDSYIYYEKDEHSTEHNPSLFKSDAKNFIECNKHHLGSKPHTYARTVWRMPKMERLVKAIYRLNSGHTKEINHEAKRAMNR